eukprot:COSAG06_NODE_8370_length_2192_cov_2.341615_3_plen_42_part_01
MRTLARCRAKPKEIFDQIFCGHSRISKRFILYVIICRAEKEA